MGRSAIIKTLIVLASTVVSSAAVGPIMIVHRRDPTIFVLPSYNDSYANWKMAGLLSVGGIPNRTTQCGATVVPSGKTPPVSGDDAALINAAIAACSTNQVVQLGAGTFNLDYKTEHITINKSIVLRGTGNCDNSGSSFDSVVSDLAHCSTIIEYKNDFLPYVNKCGITLPGSTCNDTGYPMIIIGSTASDWANCDWNSLPSPAVCGAVALDSPGAQGDIKIQVHSTAPFSIGMWVRIDEASGAGWVNDPTAGTSGSDLVQVWAALDFLNTSGSPATARVAYSKHKPDPGWGDYSTPGQYPYQSGQIGCSPAYGTLCDRGTGEIHKIISIGAGPCPGVNCTLTFDSPLTVAMRTDGPINFTGTRSGTSLTTTGDSCQLVAGQLVSGLGVTGGTYVSAVGSCSGGIGSYTVTTSQSLSARAMTGGAYEAQVYYPDNGGTPTALLEYAGVENLTLARSHQGHVNFYYCAYCWAKNVEVFGSNGPNGGAFGMNQTARVQIDTVYSDDGYNNVNNGWEYPIDIMGASTECYIVNSITRRSGKGMTARGGGAGCVVAYNYFDANYYLSGAGGNQWIEMSANASHLFGPHHVLFEGNWAVNLDNDWTHGNNTYLTYFRNYANTMRSQFIDPSTSTTITDTNTSGAGPLRAVGPMAYNYWHAFVGNVLGKAGTSTSGNGWSWQGHGQLHDHAIFMDGWMNNYNDAYDTKVFTYMWRHGNYDTVHGSIFEWQTSGCGGTCSHAMPGSFYLKSAPSWWPSGYTWPWVTPEGSTKLFTNPAKARFDAGTPFVQP